MSGERTLPIKTGSRAVVVGAGRSGRAAVRLLLRQGACVRLLEKDAARVDPAFAEEVRSAGAEICCGEHTPEQFAQADYVIPSPGMPVSLLRPLLPAAGGPEILSEMELGWRHLQGEPVLAVTGTSGKTTTVSLAAAMLRQQGFKVFLGGNIGTPLCEYVLSGDRADILVMEVSSFQLQTCGAFRPHVGVMLNITENHLDYHKDMHEYIDAKFHLFRRQEAEDVAVMGASLAPLAASYDLKGRQVFFETTDRFPRMRLLGRHNRANAEAAWLACREFGVTLENAAAAVAAFTPLPHRLESVAEKEGVLYVNDSKCTTVSSLKVALEAFERPVLLLCGGKFKGGDLPGLRDLVREKVRYVALFGASREHFETAWKDVVPMSWRPTLAEAVGCAREQARPGDVLLLAPATSSFDLYVGYKARGEDFRAIVGALP